MADLIYWASVVFCWGVLLNTGCSWAWFTALGPATILVLLPVWFVAKLIEKVLT